MIENKTIVIASYQAKGAIAEHGSFGWSIAGTKSLNLKQAKQANPKLVYNKGDNFFDQIIFQRDTNIPHYEEIKKLEEQYDALGNQATGTSDKSDLFLGFCLGYWFLIIPLLLLPFAYILRAVSQKKIMSRAEENTNAQRMRAALAAQAKKLLENQEAPKSITDL